MVMGTEVDTAMVVVLEVESAESASAGSDDGGGDGFAPLAAVVPWVFELGSLVVVVGLSGEEGEVDVVVGV